MVELKALQGYQNLQRGHPDVKVRMRPMRLLSETCSVRFIVLVKIYINIIISMTISTGLEPDQ